MSNLHVGVNTLFLALGNYGGIETYVRELLHELPALDPAVAYTLFTSPQSAGTFGVQAPTIQEIVCPLPRIANRKVAWSSRLVYEYGVLPRQAARQKVDVLFSPCFTAPAHSRYASVVTIPDMQYIDMPENFAMADRAVFTRVLSRSVRAAAHILTISEHAKRRIIAHYHVPPERVTVTYLAASPSYFTSLGPDALARVRERYGLHAPYILSVATLHPHKNLDLLIDAFVQLRQMDQTARQLALVGLRGPAFDALEMKIRRAGLAGQVILTGYVPGADLPALYQGAEVFVLPSRYEGFGIPILEAMASGTPVVTTTATSLPEIAGDAALLVEPDDREGLVNAMRRVFEEPALRATLRARGREQAARFSWQTAAEMTHDVFLRVAHGATGRRRV